MGLGPEFEAEVIIGSKTIVVDTQKPDWDVYYTWKDGTKIEVMSIFSVATINEALKEAEYSLTIDSDKEGNVINNDNIKTGRTKIHGIMKRDTIV